MAQINTRENAYKGIDHEAHHGMTMTGRIIRDAWVFGLLPEGDGFANKNSGELQLLIESVHAAWEPFGQLPSRLPADLAERHERIHAEAINRAKRMGWDPELSDDD